MTLSDLKDRVLKIVSRVMDVPVGGLDEKSSMDTVGKWDSLRHMNLVLAFEEEFGAEIPDEDAEKLTTVGAVINYLKEKGFDA